MAEQGSLTLAIETSNPSAGGEPGVALGLTSRLGVAVLAVEPIGRGDRHDDLLMPAIDRVFRAAGCAPRDLERIAVSIGPGGYTGLRIATAAASVLGMTTGAMVLGIPSAWVAARRVRAGGPFAVCLAGKAHNAWIELFEADGTPRGNGSLLDAEEIARLPVERWIGDRFLPSAARTRIEASGGVIEPPVFDPVAAMELAWSVPPAPRGAVTPLYGREAEAVTRWRALHGET
ncbi:MAG: tRNA (adenosine(37)-N6)-threonylcarbamoyltransferase complex dimerization subunit type 1 TsaB [Phycisphaerales bacterium]